MLLVVHYHKVTGQIGAWGNMYAEESHLPDHLIARFKDGPQDITPRTHRIDVATALLIKKSAYEMALDNVPRLFEVTAGIQVELGVTDRYMLSDQDASALEGWTTYRKALRDASKGNTTAASILAAVPKRPDGVDAFSALRQRLM